MIITDFQLKDTGHICDMKPEGWDDIVPHFRFYARSPFCEPVKLVSDGRIAGVGAAMMHRNTAWLAHIIVHEDFRNRGFGYAITHELVSRLQRRKFLTIYLDATELGYPVYLKNGFEIECEYIHFEGAYLKKKPSRSPFLKRFNENFRNEILKLDRKVSGEYRGSVINKHMKSAYIFEQKGKLSGVYFPSLANGLIIAMKKDAGIELMKLRLTKNDKAIFPAANNTAINFMNENNFIVMRRSKRMIWGKKRKWKPEDLYNRISGALG